MRFDLAILVLWLLPAPLAAEPINCHDGPDGTMSHNNMEADHDPAYGSTFEVWVRLFNPGTGMFDQGSHYATFNQSAGGISAEDVGS